MVHPSLELQQLGSTYANLHSAAPYTTESGILLLSALQMFLHDHLSKHSVWSGAVSFRTTFHGFIQRQ
ncbi:hypothetical protein T4B_1027 [Trichinella pseudospiralis]|uniref:Uncharacterized protein n=1 Tax=Trichinella pseudospiralis TaxID=6337 RepID=A0A0V1GEE4_TRIPS|nr:hypothetical protein T4B_1027 [Trichinella pseudospiralis]